MTRKEELLAAYDDVWSHRWESMGKLFDGISDEEANFQHESYRDAERYPDDPEPGTVLWYIHHLAHCYRHYIEVIKLRPERVEPPEAPKIVPVQEMLVVMKEYRDKLRSTVADLPEDTLDETVYNGDTVAAFVRMVTRHDSWHSGQIAVARRLYRTRPI
jgi:uncharacterized damage-inducible protein DinB